MREKMREDTIDQGKDSIYEGTVGGE